MLKLMMWLVAMRMKMPLLIQATESEARLSRRQMMMIANSRYSGSFSTIVVINVFNIISIDNIICRDVFELILLCIKAPQKLIHNIPQYLEIITSKIFMLIMISPTMIIINCYADHIRWTATEASPIKGVCPCDWMGRGSFRSGVKQLMINPS